MLRSFSRLFPFLRGDRFTTRPAGAARRQKTFLPSLEGLESRLVPSSVPLHVEGNQLADPANNPVVLRGVNVISLEWRPDGDNVMQAVSIALQDWHANLIRLPVNEDFWFGHDQAWTGADSGDGGAAYRDLVDQVIATARASNAYVMLDLHWSDMGVWGANNGQHFLPDDNSTLFWQDAAPRYANDPAVLFDPYNEPHFANDQPSDADFAMWRNGGTVQETGEFQGTYHSPGMQGLIDTIRAAGANNVVAPEGLNWGSNLAGVLNGYALSDPAGNLMYQSHLYPNKLADDQVASSVEAVAQGYPIYVGEWGSGGVVGQPDADAAASNQQMLSYLDSHPNFSWTAWALTPDLGGEYNLLTSWDAASTTSDYGAYVQADLAAHVNDQLPPVVTPTPAPVGSPPGGDQPGTPPNGTPPPVVTVPNGGQVVFPSTTVGAYDAATDTWFLRTRNSSGAPDAGQFAFGMPGWISLTGDWHHTGHMGIGVYDPATATFYLRNEANAGPADAGIFQYGLPGWTPVTGDWSGTDHAGIGVVDPATGTWYLRNEASAGAPDAGTFQYGAPGWTPVVGDWNGDGRVTVGVVDPATMTWYLRNKNSGGVPDVAAPFRYGLAGWKPVVGDWTGTGHTGIGVFNPDGSWLLRNTASPGSPDIAPFAYGLGTWTPLAGNWNSSSAAGAARTSSADALAAIVDSAQGILGGTGGARRTQALDEVFAAGNFGSG